MIFYYEVSKKCYYLRGMKAKKKESTTVKLTDFQRMALQEIAEQKDVTRHAVIIEAVDEKIEKEISKKKK